MGNSVKRGGAGEIRPAVIANAKRIITAPQAGTTVLSLLDWTARELDLVYTLERVGDRHWDTVTGVLLMDGREARIIVRETDPLNYQNRCILHELGHILCGHSGCAALGELPAGVDPSLRFDLLRGRGANRRTWSTICKRPTLAFRNEREAEEVARISEEYLYRPTFLQDELAWAVSE